MGLEGNDKENGDFFVSRDFFFFNKENAVLCDNQQEFQLDVKKRVSDQVI